MSDPDGDTVKCRWAVRHETNDNAVHGSNLSSLSLDTETCTVTYDQGSREIFDHNRFQ